MSVPCPFRCPFWCPFRVRSWSVPESVPCVTAIKWKIIFHLVLVTDAKSVPCPFRYPFWCPFRVRSVSVPCPFSVRSGVRSVSVPCPFRVRSDVRSGARSGVCSVSVPCQFSVRSGVRSVSVPECVPDSVPESVPSPFYVRSVRSGSDPSVLDACLACPVRAPALVQCVCQ